MNIEHLNLFHHLAAASGLSAGINFSLALLYIYEGRSGLRFAIAGVASGLLMAWSLSKVVSG